MDTKDSKEQQIAISEFKTHCLELLERLRQDGGEIVVTKRGVPIARVSPIRKDIQPLKGTWAGMIEIKGEIVECDWSDLWDALK